MITCKPKDFVPKFFNDTSETYDRITHWATFGRDEYWKKVIISNMNSPNSILDLACGTGILTRGIASKFPNSTITGVDITKSYLEKAKKNSTKFRNITYVLQDAEELDLKQKYDCICSSYIPKYCNPHTLVKNCILHLNPGGMIILHDFVYPKNSIIQKMWNTHFVLLNFCGLFIPEWKSAFKILPKIIRTCNWVANYHKEFEQKNFDIKRINLTLETSAIIIATLKEKNER